VKDQTQKLGITLPMLLLRETDKVRGDVPRSTFIRRAIEQFLGKEGKRSHRPILRRLLELLAAASRRGPFLDTQLNRC
jgi:metal-responsive CopG/Arc/MetJ family transcriptional regulator